MGLWLFHVISSPCNTNSLWFSVISRQHNNTPQVACFVFFSAILRRGQRVSESAETDASGVYGALYRVKAPSPDWPDDKAIEAIGLDDWSIPAICIERCWTTECNLQKNHSHEGWCNELIVSAEAQDDRPSGGHKPTKKTMQRIEVRKRRSWNYNRYSFLSNCGAIGNIWIYVACLGSSIQA